jgi:predicted HicB family RNase H-like nuclease
MMKYKDYLARVVFDDEIDAFHGEVVNIRDVITFQGQSVEELHQAFIDSIEDYLEFCLSRGEPPNTPFSGRFTIYLPPEQHRKIIFAAEKSGKPVDTWIAEILEKAVV